MIELSPLARPYAKAVFTAALDIGQHHEVAAQLSILSSISQTTEVSSLIEDPELSKNKIAQFISYQELLEEHNKTSSIVVNVASLPSADNKKTIMQKLSTSYGEGSSIEFVEDSSIMGGLSIKIGDETLDLSIRGKVKKLVNQLNF
ncbi:MAG: F0F1 ATP synthase subunit delta [Gammaproteobacteria bacterium]